MKQHLILRVVAKLLIPLIALFALYVQFHGDYGPGGGFQAGVILSASAILYGLVFGLEAMKQAIPPTSVRIAMSLGIFIYGGTGVLCWLLGGEFLNYNVLSSIPSHGQHYGILAVELGVLVTVSSVMMAIFYAFSSREPDLSDRDW